MSYNDIALELTEKLNDIVNESWGNGNFIRSVGAVTADLLQWWFDDDFCAERSINFHEGQRQAILNLVYCHEVLGVNSVVDLYKKIFGKVEDGLMEDLLKNQGDLCKYCVKMATGTGKTWVMNAILVWQYLNAKNYSKCVTSNFIGGAVVDGDEDGRFLGACVSGNVGDDLVERRVVFAKNFLIIAPSLMVYDRLLDAFLGKENENRIRDFESADLKKNEELFVPKKYRNDLFAFVQNSVVKKDEIGKKITGDGVIVIANSQHFLSDLSKFDEEEEEEKDVDNMSYKKIITDLLPITPGANEVHSLSVLDSRYFNGGELEYLGKLENICVFNDEAHHIHENKNDVVKWQKILNCLSAGKGDNFIQVDFSATPYTVKNVRNNQVKKYFYHVMVDYGLPDAIRAGLVKTIVIDKREEIASIKNDDLDFKAVRSDNGVVSLSEGQEMMLKAGLKVLSDLEKEFKMVDDTKYPKMLVVCEDTNVSPFIEEYLKNECGLAEDDVFRIDSNRKGDVGEEEWGRIKQTLFNIDKKKQPRVIISVLMLREGFDVNNICVIVPLRSAGAQILLEQTIGRGLRLMWRDEEYKDIKEKNRKKILEDKEAPDGSYDILHIIEHPNFIKFYQGLEENIQSIDFGFRVNTDKMIKAELKKDYEKYDFYIPIIVKEEIEYLVGKELNYWDFEKSNYSVEQLKSLIRNGKNEEIFYSNEILKDVRFGEYAVYIDLFNVNGYNDLLNRIVNTVCRTVNVNISSMVNFGGSKFNKFPMLQINQHVIIKTIDNYIKKRFFGKPFNPLVDDNWRLLMLKKQDLIGIIVKQMSKVICDMQSNIDVEEAVVKKEYFSQVATLPVRENYSLELMKTIYTKTQYPSNRGGFEKDFMMYVDADCEVERFVKINERRHNFVNFQYINENGLIRHYFPDFMVKIADEVYIVETKACRDLNNYDVNAKKKGALNYVNRINKLKADDRMDAVWHYCIVDDKTFYEKQEFGASVKDILMYCELVNNNTCDDLFEC